MWMLVLLLLIVAVVVFGVVCHGLADRLCQVENRKEPDLNDVVELLLKKIDPNGKCPRCGGVITPRARYCRFCGEEFFGQYKGARILRCSYKNRITCLEWQCLECGEIQEDEFDPDQYKKSSVFIHILECEKCGDHIADVLIDPTHWKQSKNWATKTGKPGTLSIADTPP